MTARNYGIKAYPLLRNTVFNQARDAWSGLDDPDVLLDVLLPALEEALYAVDDSTEAAEILLNVYDQDGFAGSTAIPLILDAALSTGSDTLTDAFEKAVERDRGGVVELLRYWSPEDEEPVTTLLFEICRRAVTKIPDPTQRLDVLRSAYQRARDVVDHPVTAETLREGHELAAHHNGEQAAEILLDQYFEAAFDDPWSCLQELMESLRATEPPVATDKVAFEAFVAALRAVVAADGVHFLWEYCELWGGLREHHRIEALLVAHEKAVQAVTDREWITAQILDACDHIASARHPSDWLPDRARVSHACTETIRALGDRVTRGNAMLREFALDVDSSKPVGALVDAARGVIGTSTDPAIATTMLLNDLSVPPEPTPVRFA